MAKRVPPHEKPYRPLDEALVRAVINPSLTSTDAKQALDQPPQAAAVPLLSIRGGRALQPAPEVAPAPKIEKLTREKRVLLTPTEEVEFERLAMEVAAQLRTQLKPSHLLRAAIMLLRHAKDELVNQSRRVGPIKRPANSDIMALTTFEHFLAELFDSALRNTTPFR
jgi:hypothetical protein